MSFVYFCRRAFIKMIRKLGLMSLINSINNFRFFLVKKYCILIKRNPLEYVYNDAFFNISDQEYALGNSPKIFAQIIKTYYNPKSVVDIGCAGGLYLRELERLGIKIFGIDGSPAASRNLVIDKSKFLLQDATVNFSLPERFDCAICFEVAEHISTDKSDVLVDNITKTSDLVFFAGSQKGQGGHDHINEQDAQFWIDKFYAKGYYLLVEDTKNIKKILCDHKVVFWLADNILIFKKANN